MKQHQAQIKAWIQALEALGHRGSATLYEDKAADLLCTELQSMDLLPQKEPFPGSTTNGGRLFLHVLIPVIGLSFYETQPWLTALFATISLLSFVIESSTRPPLLSQPLVQSRSRNVTALLPSITEKPALRLVLMAHYDTQRTGLMWFQSANSHMDQHLAKAPGPLKSPMFPVSLSFFLQILAGIGLSLAFYPLLCKIILGLCSFVYLLSLIFLGDWAIRSFVPGANDNASGVATILALAKQWQSHRPPDTDDVEIVLLLTGCEETGLLGAAAWAEKHKRASLTTPTFFLNVDSIGYGSPEFIGGEYTLAGLPVRYHPDMLSLCQEVAKDLSFKTNPLIIPVQTDGLAFIVRGIQGVSILCRLDDGSMPNYHLPTDTSDRMDDSALEKGSTLAWALLQKMSTDPRCRKN